MIKCFLFSVNIVNSNSQIFFFFQCYTIFAFLGHSLFHWICCCTGCAMNLFRICIWVSLTQVSFPPLTPPQGHTHLVFVSRTASLVKWLSNFPSSCMACKNLSNVVISFSFIIWCNDLSTWLVRVHSGSKIFPENVSGLQVSGCTVQRKLYISVWTYVVIYILLKMVSFHLGF